MALTFGEINTEIDGSGTSIPLGDVAIYEPILGNGMFNKSLPFSKSDEKFNLNLFGTTRRIRIVGTIDGADVATFSTLINDWYDERQSAGRYVRGKFDTTARKVTIETARLPESFPTDIIANYELVLIEGAN